METLPAFLFAFHILHDFIFSKLCIAPNPIPAETFVDSV